MVKKLICVIAAFALAAACVFVGKCWRAAAHRRRIAVPCDRVRERGVPRLRERSRPRRRARDGLPRVDLLLSRVPRMGHLGQRRVSQRVGCQLEFMGARSRSVFRRTHFGAEEGGVVCRRKRRSHSILRRLCLPRLRYCPKSQELLRMSGWDWSHLRLFFCISLQV